MQAKGFRKRDPERLWNLLYESRTLSSEEQREQYEASVEALAESPATSSEVILRELMGPNWLYALEVARRFPPADLLPLFPGLVRLAGWGHSSVLLVRKLIQSLPRAWVLNRIEDEAEVYLQAGDDNEYRRYMELYSDMRAFDSLRRLAARAAQSDNFDIREAGEEYLEMLEKENRS